jgi:PAS domain S-box-containing protein
MKSSMKDIVVNAGFGLALLTLVLIGSLCYLNFESMTEFDRMVERSHAVILELEGLLSDIKDVENGEHMFIFTGEDRNLEPYRSAILRIERHLAALKSLNKNHPNHQIMMSRVEALVRETLAETGKTVDIRRKEGFRAVYQMESAEQDEGNLVKIRQELTAFENVIGQHLDNRKASKMLSYRNMILSFITGTALSLILLVTIFVLLRKDIAERKKAEMALRKSEEKFVKIFQSVPAIIGITTIDEGRCIDLNDIGLQTLGYQREEVVGKTMLDLGIWERKSDRVHAIQVLKEKRRVRDLEITFRSKNGKRFTGLYSAELIEFNNEQYILSIVNDISERKQLEIEIKKLNFELDAANKELEAFNYTVAHDLKQPLNLISLNCQAIQRLCSEQLQKECRDYVKGAYDCTLRMSRLIDALLNFSRLTHLEPLRGEVDLSALVHEVANELKSAEPERKVDFQIAEGITAHADAGLMRVVLHNLLGNAWKYTGKREQAVIEFGVTAIDGMQAYFIRDNGGGFDHAYGEKLFVPFQRLPGAEEHQGFGVGLATVERIIRRHGGKIWAEGEPDKGATFSFTLSSDGI